jgi:Xaa-Pro aminopeptidase
MENATMEKTSMEQLHAQMKEYVKMEEELEFPLFSSYYQQVMAFLQADYQELGSDELVQAQGICGVMAANAEMRAAKKDVNRKKFQKIKEKSEFWMEAIKARLKKEGMSDDELTQKMEGLWD